MIERWITGDWKGVKRRDRRSSSWRRIHRRSFNRLNKLGSNEECTPDIVECTFIQSNVTELPFFASKVRLGKNGIEEVLGLGPLSEFEKQGLESLKPELKLSIEKGIKFAREN
ncbi:hypothetical protein HPP92_023690 [Vanilla planifolia]|uniref:Lactate/malate dehydrogenase C-terminal domain-containing protein n=1 Tax=Vanilla planifolia TaxID=51239 RepID=A0A835UBV8_VANPL|nr:hypothetical protein HPP92_023690 [Vanilla planifolia]